MPGVRLASADGSGWTVETVDLGATGRRRRTKRVVASLWGCFWARGEEAER